MLIANRNGMVVGGKLMTQITLTQNCTNCRALADHVMSLLSSKGISNAMCSIDASETRNNLVGIIPVILGTVYDSTHLLRYRNGTWGDAQTSVSYDADARIGDVYNVYVPDGLWNSANLNGGGGINA